MRILLINDYWLSMLGWWEVHITKLIKLLESDWHKVSLITWSLESWNQLLSFYNSWFRKRLAEYISKEPYDVVHIHSISRNISISFLSEIRKFWIPIVMTVHSFAYNCPKTLWLRKWSICYNKWFFTCLCSSCASYSKKKWIYKILEDAYKVIKINFHISFLKRYVDAFICPSNQLTLLLKNKFQNSEKILYIPNFIEVKWNESPNYSDTDFNKVLFVWRLSKEKWIITLIKAIHSLKKENKKISLEIIGDGPDMEHIDQLITQLWLVNVVRLLWRVDNNEIWNYYKKAGILVIPSEWLENNPIVWLEWLRYWKAIIASNIWWLTDIVDDEQNWLLFNMGNSQELSQKIWQILWNEKSIINMWVIGYRKALDCFSQEIYLHQINNLYKKVVKWS